MVKTVDGSARYNMSGYDLSESDGKFNLNTIGDPPISHQNHLGCDVTFCTFLKFLCRIFV